MVDNSNQNAKAGFLKFYYFMPDFIKNLMRCTLFFIEYISDYELRFYLKENKKLKNIHTGKRCFILGNGSSLLSHNLDFLKDEIVFTVNSLPEADFYKELEADYHVMIDPSYFNLEEPDIIEKLKTIVSKIAFLDKTPQLILLYKGINLKEYFRDLGLNNFFFVYSGLAPSKPKRLKINMSGLMTGAQNVISKAIFCAIYMGFKEIILIGCDAPLYLKYYSRGQYIYEDWLHAYDNEREVFDTVHYTNAELLVSQLKMMNSHKQIRIYCDKKGIKVFNATVGGTLDMFERKEFESFFEDKT